MHAMPAMSTVESKGPFGLVTVANVLIFYGLEQPAPEMIDRIRQRIVALAAAHAGGVGYVHALDLKLAWRTPNPDRRRAYMDLTRDASEFTKAVLVVIDREGFIGAAIRAVVSGVVLSSRATTPIKIVPRLVDGSDWFASRMRSSGADCPSPRELELALGQLKHKTSFNP
jgi:hypothetical protein